MQWFSFISFDKDDTAPSKHAYDRIIQMTQYNKRWKAKYKTGYALVAAVQNYLCPLLMKLFNIMC